MTTKLCNHNLNNDCNSNCLTRSELQALLRESINTLKHDMKTHNVTAHMFETEQFKNLKDYISENLSRFTVITDKCFNRKVHFHRERVNRIFDIKTSLLQEYDLTVKNVYKKQKW
ncbi:lef11 [Oxyplax ochracea nucleopolyhedrovirus]|uniref:Late expression factor 11 n=1 Tax=Oxyplax ochracea nucleopolyhedrovirus TaxID=2083176 RepID=A0A2L0WU92_9ABAC|nr:lef11 [Oxyplax ochracea nucleopolyhedrovirus]AVA31219.1 lef11 [Oxyplax ochracea nucleopolyhedrovirus]